MTDYTDLTHQLAEAQRSGSLSVDQAALAGIGRADTYGVQRGVMAALGERPGMLKVWTNADGDAAVAPIYASRIGDSAALRLPAASVTGLEVEIGVVLRRDLPPGSDRAAVDAAIERFFTGIEVCGTRFIDRTQATFDAGLADNMSALGYAFGPVWPHGASLNGADIEITFAGKPIYGAPAKHGFGGVLNALYAYAALPGQPYPLTAGTIVTTGSLCGLVPVRGAGTGVARLGDVTMTVELV